MHLCFFFSLQITYVGNVVLSLDSSKSSSSLFKQKMHCESKCNHQECSLLKVETNDDATENRLITSLKIPQTHLKLTFSGKTSVKKQPQENSAISPPLNRTLSFYLTGAQPHYSLWRVRIKVMIEGEIFEDTLEAEANMKWNLRWNGLDAYGQKIIGQTIAIIEVGYQFTGMYSTKNSAIFNLCFKRVKIPYTPLVASTAQRKKMINEFWLDRVLQGCCGNPKITKTKLNIGPM